MDRIEINGIWYVKEDTIEKEIIELNPILSEEITVENNDFCFVATKMFKEDTETQLGDIDIKFTDKRVKPWKEETWDHLGFFRGCIERNPDSLLSLRGESGFNTDDVENFIAFLKEIQKRGWL